MEYLRKRSLGYIYNSRVSKHHKHIKYRNIIMRNMSDPENFTVMKEFWTIWILNIIVKLTF